MLDSAKGILLWPYEHCTLYVYDMNACDARTGAVLRSLDPDVYSIASYLTEVLKGDWKLIRASKLRQK